MATIKKNAYKKIFLYGITTFLVDTGLAFAVIYYRSNKIKVTLPDFFRAIKYNVQVFPQSAVVIILFNAIALTYFTNIRSVDAAAVKGIFVITVIWGIFLWFLKLYIINYF